MKIRIRESKRLNEGTIDDLKDLGADVINAVIKLARLEQSTRDRIITNLGGMSKNACNDLITKWEEGPLGRGAHEWSPVEKGFKAVADQPLREGELDEGPVWDAAKDWAGKQVDAVQTGARAEVKKRLSRWIASSATTVAETVVPGVYFEKKIEESLADTMASKSDDIAECIVSMVPILN